MNRRPVIIIGAARSGTNMLRDVLTRLPGLGTWPCDEIPFIWRHGNARFVSDEFEPGMARPRVQKYIRRRFDDLESKLNLSTVVEKTCANSLRVGFVDAVFPEARYLHIVRDGRDVVASAVRRWTAPFDASYTLAKARWVPLSDLPYYGLHFIANRMSQLSAADRRLPAWGPRFQGMSSAVASRSVEAVSALQWARSLERSEQAFLQIPTERVLELTYESFVTDPRHSLEKVVSFLELDCSDDATLHAASIVHGGSVGRWREALSTDAQLEIAELLRVPLQRRGYA